LTLGFAVAAGLTGAVFDWNLPNGFPRPAIPADNPMSAVKVELGRYLFYDGRMSVNGKESCGTCHRQELAFTDGRSRAQGTTGQLHPRGSMSLVNVAYVPFLT
jgi:cytochrome c peroxidase